MDLITSEAEEELSLKDVIEKVKVYGTELWSKKWIILILATLITLFFTFISLRKEPEYHAPLTFMVNDDESGGLGGLGAILGEFGMGGGGSSHNYSKIVKIAQSTNILTKVIYDSTIVNGKLDLLGNHIIHLTGMKKNWDEDTLLNNFRFVDKNNSDFKSSREVRRNSIAIKSVVSKLRGNLEKPDSRRLVSIFVDEESSVITILGQTSIPELSIALANTWYEKLSEFYISQSIERQQTTYDVLSMKADSLYGLMLSAEASLAQYADQSNGVMLYQNQLPKARNQRKVEMYGAMYAEVLKNQQTAEFLLHSQTPFFQTLDVPFLPLGNANNFSLILSLIVFIVATIFIVLLYAAKLYYNFEIKPLI